MLMLVAMSFLLTGCPPPPEDTTEPLCTEVPTPPPGDLTVTVNVVFVEGSTANEGVATSHLNKANEIYDPHGITIEVNSMSSLTIEDADPDDKDGYDFDPGSADEISLFDHNQVVADSYGAADVTIYYVTSIKNGTKAGYGYKPGGAKYRWAEDRHFGAVMSDAGDGRTLGHELGHVFGLYHIGDIPAEDRVLPEVYGLDPDGAPWQANLMYEYLDGGTDLTIEQVNIAKAGILTVRSYR